MPLEGVDAVEWVWMMLGCASWDLAVFCSLLMISLPLDKRYLVIRVRCIQTLHTRGIELTAVSVNDTQNRTRFAGVAEIGHSTSNTKVCFFFY